MNIRAKLVEICDASNAHDPDRIMSFFADDCMFEMPKGREPYGSRFERKHNVREGLATRLKDHPAYITGVQSILRIWKSQTGTSKWCLTGTGREGKKVEVRGCDFYTLLASAVAALPAVSDGLVLRHMRGFFSKLLDQENAGASGRASLGPTEQLALVVFPQFRDEIHKDNGDVRPIRHLREISPNPRGNPDIMHDAIMTTQVAAMRGHALAAEVTPISFRAMLTAINARRFFCLYQISITTRLPRRVAPAARFV
jgi:ketosteroid isomerase-like protein